MKLKILALLVIILVLFSGLVFANEEEIKVLKLPYGVSVELGPDERMPIEWWHTFTFDASQDFNTKVASAFLGFSFGNTITDFTIGYSKEFNLETTDQGTASFSFTWSF